MPGSHNPPLVASAASETALAEFVAGVRGAQLSQWHEMPDREAVLRELQGRDEEDCT